MKEFRELEADSDSTSDRWLWIDQLSIDQTNVRERNHQVRDMHTIYRCANSVIVWLGEGYERYRGDARSLYEAATEFKNNSDPSALTVILQNHYFSRLWIVQEFLSAQRLRILIRNQWIPESSLKNFDDDHPRHLRSRLRQVTVYLMLTRTGVDGGVKWQDLRGALTKFSHNACEDSRDKIYGLLGLVRPEDRPRDIDYAKSPQQVFADAMLAIFRTDPLFTTSESSYSSSVSTARNEDLYMLALNMRFTEPQLLSLKVVLKSLWHPWRLPLFHGRPCPITAMGFDAAGSTPDSGDRWWFDFHGKRYYAECKHHTTVFAFKAETVRLLTERWGKYLEYSVESTMSGAKRERRTCINAVKSQLIVTLGACWSWSKRLVAKILGSHVPEHGLDDERSPLLHSHL